MKHAITNDKHGVRAATEIGVREKSDIGVRALKVVFRASVVLTFAVVFLIGAWAVLALVSAAVGSGGVMELIKGWFGAVGG